MPTATISAIAAHLCLRPAALRPLGSAPRCAVPTSTSPTEPIHPPRLSTLSTGTAALAGSLHPQSSFASAARSVPVSLSHRHPRRGPIPTLLQHPFAARLRTARSCARLWTTRARTQDCDAAADRLRGGSVLGELPYVSRPG